MSRGVFLVAAEPSGDALGAGLIAALRARAPDLRFAGVGGAAMAAEGVVSPFSIEALSIVGFIEGLQAYSRVVALADQAADAAVAARPDAVVLIDSWGFTLRVAQRLRARLPGVPLIKYVGPQVWASRPGRARTLAAAVDHLLCIHAFETPFYAPYGLPCTVVGNPVVGAARRGDGQAFLAAYDGPVAPKRLLLLLPGSRRSEVARMLPVLRKAAHALAATRPDMLSVIYAAPAVRDLIVEDFGGLEDERWTCWHRLAGEETRKEDVFAAATAAIACSGTVTTEVGLQGAPVVVGYRLDWPTWAIARGLGIYRAPFATLMNLAAGREIAPEFLQTRCTPANLAAAAAPLLDDPAARAAQIAAQDEALIRMGRGGRPASEIAADVVEAYLRRT
jgi:lipid-A-disaccharide synthase